MYNEFIKILVNKIILTKKIKKNICLDLNHFSSDTINITIDDKDFNDDKKYLSFNITPNMIQYLVSKYNPLNIYIPARYYNYNHFTTDRVFDIVLLGENNTERQKRFIDTVNETHNLNPIVVNNIRNLEQSLFLYKNTKIIINIHPSDNDTIFDEMIYLPPFSSGVIIISEKTVLSHLLPYNNFIFWSDIENMPNTVKYVLENYNTIFNVIYGDNTVKDIIGTLYTNAIYEINKCINYLDNI
jgi:hypothetical protein